MKDTTILEDVSMILGRIWAIVDNDSIIVENHYISAASGKPTIISVPVVVGHRKQGTPRLAVHYTVGPVGGFHRANAPYSSGGSAFGLDEAVRAIEIRGQRLPEAVLEGTGVEAPPRNGGC